MSNPEFEIVDLDWSQKLETEYEEYMWNCEALVDLDPDAEEVDATFEPLSGQPYCGCSTCYTREQLFFLVPRILKAYKNGQIALTEDIEAPF